MAQVHVIRDKVLREGISQRRVALEADSCVDALEEALSGDLPGVFNTDQGSQFTSEAFTSVLVAHGVRISMDSVGSYMDNVFVERLWRSVKYEEVYLKAGGDSS